MSDLNTVEVIFENDIYNYNTSVSAITTKEDAEKYFIRTVFNCGMFPYEDMQECININYKSQNNV